MKVLLGLAFGTTLFLSLLLVMVYLWFLPYRDWEKNGSELTALTTAVFWESAVLEPKEGRKAIMDTIMNRRNSASFPDTIREVVVQGVKPGRRTGCQFSFACDGEIEMPERLCELRPRDTARLGAFGCQRRWLEFLAEAAWYLYVYRGNDITGGADHYFTGPKPYWYSDLIPCTVKRIGSHTFGQAEWTKSAAECKSAGDVVSGASSYLSGLSCQF